VDDQLGSHRPAHDRVLPTSFIVGAESADAPGGLFQQTSIIGGWTWIATVAW
jgi:hypothetical protein